MRAAATSDACAWDGPVSVFLETTAATRGDSDLLTSLTAHYHRCMNMGPDAGQVSAWRHEIAVLRDVLADIAARVPRARHWQVIFEYELPRERGRRPDVVILTGSQVMVLEFKDAAAPQQAHIDQVSAYARDLSEYHAASHDKLIDPVLVLRRCRTNRREWWGRRPASRSGTRPSPACPTPGSSTARPRSPTSSATRPPSTPAQLDLTVSLRTHLAEDVQEWVASLREGRLEEAADLATRVRRQGFGLYLTSSRDQAEAYVRERYRGQEEARYGLLASSKAPLSDHGIYADWQATRRLRVEP